MQNKKFFGLNLVDEKWTAWQEDLAQLLDEKELKLVMTPNPEQIMLARRERRFLEYLRAADYLLPDGQGLVWAVKVQTRLTGADTVKEILKIAAEKKMKVLLIGGRYESETGQLRVKNGDGETMIFYTQGYQNIKKIAQSEEKSLQLLISELKPEVVLVALGAPMQEKWLVEHKEMLQENGVRLAMSVGGSFDFLLGKLKRAPQSWQNCHLEWLWRLIQEPGRIKRQLVLPQFAWLVITGRLK